MSTEASFSAADRPPLALIAGPTASGKSDLAVQLGLALQRRGTEAVVINADSAQVYADLAVLSARPSAADMRGIAHRLFGSWDGAQACSAADWAAAAAAEIAQTQARGAVPIVVGGTGLYIRTLLDGIAPVPPVDPAVRDAVRALDTPALAAALHREDPPAASRLNPADRQRLARALEVVRATGRPLADWHSRREGGIADQVTLHPAILMPPRAVLYARCDARFTHMIAAGAADEVAALLERQLDPALPVMTAIGVREIAAWLHGVQSEAEAVAQGQQATRNYAKRQYTWMRNQPPRTWPRFVEQDFNVEDIFVSLLRD